MIASGCKDQTVRIWDWQSRKCIQTLRSHTEQVRTVAFSPNGGLVASGSDDKTIKIWSISTGQCIKTLYGHSDWIFSISFDPASNLLASGGDDQRALPGVGGE
jgi:WD40 repeat protein